MLQFTNTINSFGQTPKSSSKVLFKLGFFSWCPLLLPVIIVLGTQIQDTKMRSSKLIIKNIAQKVVAKYVF